MQVVGARDVGEMRQLARLNQGFKTLDIGDAVDF